MVAGEVGRFIETDEELRIRHRENPQVKGSATAKAIKARILEDVDSVSYCAVYENMTFATNSDGMPPLSIEVVIQGGAVQSIGDKLFEVKGAAIQTHGNTSVNVIDVNGDLQVCKFSRPVTKFAWVRVTVTALNSEEALTASASQAIKDAVLSYGQSLSIGQDLITQRFYGPIYGGTSGIGQLLVEIDVTDTDAGPPTYSASNYVLSRGVIAEFSEPRITVVGV